MERCLMLPKGCWITREAIANVGACISGVIDWHLKHAPDESAIAPADPRLPDNEFVTNALGGYGCGDGYGDGYGDGSGRGYGDGSGDGYGYGYGDGYGYGCGA
jgi:hypothetical protein